MSIIKKKFEQVLGVDFSNHNSHWDIEIGEWLTADGYNLWVMTTDAQDLNWETDVFYNEPRFDDIIKYIQDYADYDATVYFPDFDDMIDDYMMLEWLEGEMNDEDYEELLERFENE